MEGRVRRAPGPRHVALGNPDIAAFAEFAQEHLVPAGRSVERLLAGARELGWFFGVAKTVTGESARADAEVPLTLFRYRTVETPPLPDYVKPEVKSIGKNME